MSLEGEKEGDGATTSLTVHQKRKENGGADRTS